MVICMCISEMYIHDRHIIGHWRERVESLYATQDRAFQVAFRNSPIHYIECTKGEIRVEPFSAVLSPDPLGDICTLAGHVSDRVHTQTSESGDMPARNGTTIMSHVVHSIRGNWSSQIE
jgi:hypothetical protein